LIFVDTSFFYASIDGSDRDHEAAVALVDRLGTRALVTTNNVRGETWTLLNRRIGHHAATAFLHALERSVSIEVVHIPPALEQTSLIWLERHDEREYSFVDETSFAFMREHRITDVLAFDGDFTAAGFTELRP